MEEYGIMEYLELAVTRAVDGKQRIYLEWPKRCQSHKQKKTSSREKGTSGKEL